jgi:hypothetical protein
MKKVYAIPTNDQLFKLASFINEEFIDVKKESMTVLFELNKDLLRQVDEDFFLKNNKGVDPNEFEPSDEVEVIISGVKIKFIAKEDES